MDATRATGGRGRLLVVGLLCVTGVAALIALYRVDPAESRLYPLCMFHALTGLYCPGCGATRAAHHLLHGDIAGALRMNALAVASLPLVGYWLLRSMADRLGRGRLPAPPKAWVVWGGIALILLFGVLRNLPWAPFTILAPPG